MNILCERKKQTTDTYTFKINQGGELGIKLKGDRGIHAPVKIVFIDGRLSEVTVPDDFADVLSQWLVMGEVAKMIADIEASYNAPQAG